MNCPRNPMKAETTDEEVVDVCFRLPGGRLPIDHAYTLFKGISASLEWFADEPAARLHQVHTAASGSGWLRPEASSGEELHLSRRTKLTLRVPKRRAEDSLALSGQVLKLGAYSLTPTAGKLVALYPASTLLARHVVCDENEEEAGLVERLKKALDENGVAGATLICGRVNHITTPDGILHTRSLVVTNLAPDGAMYMLREGIGPGGKLGCGVFIPYKRIE